MKNMLSKFVVIQMPLLIILSSCSSPIDKIQGIYSVDKNSLKEQMQKEMKEENALASILLNKAIENSIIELEVKGDSLKGLIFMMGTSVLVSSKILVRNDSLVAKTEKSEIHLTPTPNGLSFKNSNSKLNIQLIKSEQNKFSTETEKALVNFKKIEREKRVFEENIGKWQKGTFVDEFGDKTNKSYAFSIVRGTHENSISVGSEVFVETHFEGTTLYFRIFNSSMTLRENFPDKKFGTIKIKYPSGLVDTERVFFFENTVSESPDDKIKLIYNHLVKSDEELKLLLDLSTASDYYSDKYHFTIKKNNLDDILKELQN